MKRVKPSNRKRLALRRRGIRLARRKVAQRSKRTRANRLKEQAVHQRKARWGKAVAQLQAERKKRLDEARKKVSE